MLLFTPFRALPRRPRGLAGALVGFLGGCESALPPPDNDLLSVGLELVAAGLTAPVHVAAPDDGGGRLFVVSQPGLIQIVTADGALLEQPFLDIRGQVVPLVESYDERGLLSLAFHPDFAANRRSFVAYSRPDPSGAFDSYVRIAEFTVDPHDANRADPASERVILEVAKPGDNHNGGQLAFGPDGFLYLSIGDGGGAGDEGAGHTPGVGNAQDRSNLLGKILRIDVDAAEPYAIPEANPFVTDPAARPEIWAYGLRNVWRFSFDDRAGGSGRLFAGDVGQNLTEEVNLIVAGGNYGWRLREGRHCFDPDSPLTAPDDCTLTAADGAPLIDPILEYSHADGTSVIGGFVYRGARLPGLVGQYVFADFTGGFLASNGRIFAAQESSTGEWSFREIRMAGRESGRIDRYIYSLGQDADGELYLVTNSVPGPTGDGGEVYRIVPSADPP